MGAPRGPFEVRVTGTTFDAAWDPLADTFELTMLEGRVVVTGPNIPPDHAVIAGEHLVVSVRGLVTPPPPSAPEGGVPVGEAPPPVPVIPARTAWKELAARGRYRDAFAAAEAAGIGPEMERAPASDLLLLADAARFSGSPGRAREALLLARRRFGVRGQSAFLLGKIAADQQGSPGDAVGWFETYLREEPGGPLAEEALGRTVDLTPRSSPEAGRAAARYLARYPDGSRAALARSLIP
jgi:transmembrane sensor